jgi:hypothetical protein
MSPCFIVITLRIVSLLRTIDQKITDHDISITVARDSQGTSVVTRTLLNRGATGGADDASMIVKSRVSC